MSPHCVAHVTTCMRTTATGCECEVSPTPREFICLLGQLFKRDTGETIGAYLSRLRVRAAAEMLCTTDTPLATLAMEHGFCDQSHFHRVFKRVSGFTPAAFRASFTAIGT